MSISERAWPLYADDSDLLSLGPPTLGTLCD